MNHKSYQTEQYLFETWKNHDVEARSIWDAKLELSGAAVFKAETILSLLMADMFWLRKITEQRMDKKTGQNIFETKQPSHEQS